MIHWEYLRTVAPDLVALGDDGWELIAVYNHEYIFKRPTEPVCERFTREQAAHALVSSSGSRASIPTILNPDLAALVRRIGHTQMLLVCDRGFPVPHGLPFGTLDLSVTSDVPTIVQVLDAILPELPHDRIIVADEMRVKSPERFAWHERGDAPVECHAHARFKKLAKEAIACVRTGDATLYGNVLVVGG